MLEKLVEDVYDQHTLYKSIKISNKLLLKYCHLLSEHSVCPYIKIIYKNDYFITIIIKENNYISSSLTF